MGGQKTVIFALYAMLILEKFTTKVIAINVGRN